MIIRLGYKKELTRDKNILINGYLLTGMKMAVLISTKKKEKDLQRSAGLPFILVMKTS